MDKTDIALVAGLLSLYIITAGGMFRVGKILERRDYAKAFIKATEATYQDGYQDGLRAGQDWAWQKFQTMHGG